MIERQRPKKWKPPDGGKRKRPRPSKRTAVDTKLDQESNASSEDAGGQSRKALTVERLQWLEQFISDAEVRIGLRCILKFALRYASMPDSKERYEREGAMVVWPSHDKLAAEFGVPRQTVAAALKRLVQRGYLDVLIQGQGSGHATEYKLVIKGKQHLPFEESKKANCKSLKGKRPTPKRQMQAQLKGNPQLRHSLISIPKDHTHSYSQGSDGGDPSVSERVKRLVGPQSELPGKGDPSNPEFAELFRIWPNKDKDRGRAFGAWINNVKKAAVDPESVLKQAKAWIGYWRISETNFIPYLGKWLREQGWKKSPPGMDLGKLDERDDEEDDCEIDECPGGISFADSDDEIDEASRSSRSKDNEGYLTDEDYH